MKDTKDPLEQSDEDLVQSDDEITAQSKKAANVKALLSRGTANDKLKSALKKLQETKAKQSGEKSEVKPNKPTATKVTKKIIAKPEKPKLMKMNDKKSEQKKSLTLAPKRKVEKQPQKPLQTLKSKKEKIPYGFCDICYQVESNLQKPGNSLLKCQGGCNMHAHQRCLGLYSQNSQQSFSCTGCLSKSQLKCAVCSHQLSKSLYFQASGWAAHYICALMCDKIEIVDFLHMKFDLVPGVTLIDGLLKADNESDQCSLCELKTGLLIRCLKRHCKKRSHMFCLQQQRKNALFKIAGELYSQSQDTDMDSDPEDDIPNEWLLDIKVQDYLQVKYLTAQANNLQEPLIEHYDFFNIERKGYNSRNFQEYCDQLVLLSPMESPTKESVNDSRNALELKPIKVVQKRHPPKINMPLRGGKISVVCEDHRHDQNCFCDQAKTQSMAQIMCDTCMVWYHSKCEGLTALQAADFDHYKCQRCKEWEVKVNKLIIPLLRNEDPLEDVVVGTDPISKDFENWDTWRQSILPNNKFRRVAFNLSDALLMAAAWTEQVNQLISGKATVNAELLRQQFIQAQYIPINLSYQLRKLNAFAGLLASHQELQKDQYLAQIQPVMVDGAIDQKALQFNDETSKRLIRLINKEKEKFCINSFKAQQLKMEYVDQIEIVEQCARIFIAKQQIDFERLSELKDGLQAATQPELAGKIKQLYWKARRWLAKADECLDKPKHQIQGDILRANDSKRSTSDAKDLISCVSLFNDGKTPAQEDDLRTEVSFTEQVEQLKAHISTTEQWEANFAKYKSQSENLDEFLELLEAQKSLQLKSQATSEIVALVHANKSWYDISIRFITPQYRQRGKPLPKPTLNELQSALKSIVSLKTNKLAQQMATKLMQIQTKFDQLTTSAKKWLDGNSLLGSTDELNSLLHQIEEMQVHTEIESQLQNLRNALNWQPDAPTLITYEALKHAQSKVALNSTLQAHFNAKLQDVEQILIEVRQIKTALLQAVKPVTLGGLKNAIAQLEKLVSIKENLMTKYKIDSAELKHGNSSHYAAPDHAFAKVASWLNRVLFHVQKLLDIRSNLQKASKDKDSLELLPQVMKIKKAMLKSLITDADGHCQGILIISSVALEILQAIKDKKGANDVETVMDEKRVSQSQLETLADKAKKMGDTQSYESLQRQIDQAKAWYQDYDKIKQNDAELQSNLIKSPESAKLLLDQVNALIAKKCQLKLETKQGITKTVQKIQKFASMMIDSRILLSSNAQIEISFERFREIADCLKNLQQAQFHCLKSYTDISEFRSILAEALRFDMFEKDIASIIKQRPYDTQAIRDRIDRARLELKINISEGVQSYLDQIDQSELWMKQASEAADETSQLALIKQYEAKKYDSLLLCDPKNVSDLKITYLRRLFKQSSSQTANDFVLKVREVLTDDLQTIMKEELGVYELGRKVRSLMWENKSGKCADNLANWKLIKIDEAKTLVSRRAELPFSIPEAFVDKFKEQIELSNQLQAQADQVMSKDCTIKQITPLYEQAKALYLSSDLAKNLAQMFDDYEMLETIWSQISNSLTQNGQGDGELFASSHLKKACKVELKIKCGALQNIKTFYESQFQNFLQIKKDVDRQKEAQKPFTLQEVDDFTKRLKELKVDFDKKESNLRSELWRIKVHLIFQEIDSKDETGKTVQSDILRYWLEEGTELELTKEAEYERLSDLVDDIDEVIKALRTCSSSQQLNDVIKVVDDRISNRLSFERMLCWLRDKFKGEDAPKSKANLSTPAEYLVMYLNKKSTSWDEDVEMDNQALIESDTDDSELLASDDDVPKCDSKVKSTGLAASLKAKVFKGPKAVKEPKMKSSKAQKNEPTRKRDKKAVEKEEKAVELTAAQIERQKKLQAMKEKLLKKSPTDADQTVEPKTETTSAIPTKKIEPEPKAVAVKNDTQAVKKDTQAIKKDTQAIKKETKAVKMDKPAQVQKEPKPVPIKMQPKSVAFKEGSVEKSIEKPKIGIKKMALGVKKFASPDKVETEAEEQITDKTQLNEAEAETSVGDGETKTKSPAQPKIVQKKPLIGFKRPPNAVGGMKGLGGGLSDELKKKLFN